MKTLTNTTKLGSWIAIMGCVLLFRPVQAVPVPINGTFAYTALGTVTFDGLTLALDQATSFTLPNWEIVTSLPAEYDGLPNDFLADSLLIIGDPVTVVPLTLPIPTGPIAGYIKFGAGNRFSYDLVSLATVSSGPNFLNIETTGIFHDSLWAYEQGSAQLNLTFTRVDANSKNAIGVFFFAVPPLLPDTGATLVLLGVAIMWMSAVARGRAR